MKYSLYILLCILLLGCQKEEPLNSPQPPEGEDTPQDSLALYGARYGFQTVVPKRDYDIVLSAPGKNSIVLTTLCYQNCTGYVTYGNASTPQVTFEAGKPQKIVLQGLTPNTDYIYQFHYSKSGGQQSIVSPKYRFSTPKNGGSSFSFAVIADSHLDQNSDTLTYQSTLKNIASEGDDFLLDLGDTFMTDKYGKDYRYALGQYVAQRYYLGGVCHSLPFYFVQGNHDGETGLKRAEMTDWAKQVRESYFPNPTSENYFAWEWGDALFIVLDPFTYTPLQGGKDPWQRTLGDNQYHWLENTLKSSVKRYKFVYIHNLVGGADIEGQARGGSEIAAYYEWGGYSPEGGFEFYTKRPTWSEPIHNLLKKYGVNVVFHGHDHLYAKQVYDGIIYQCVPQPSLKRYDNQIYGDTYGYKSGVLKYNPGHIRVTVSQSQTRVEYITSKNIILDTYTL